MTTTQEKLTPEQHKNIKKVVKLLENGRLTFDFKKHPECELLCDALLLMCDVAKHGTSDGKPAVKSSEPTQ
jgi:hypothetical protein